MHVYILLEKRNILEQSVIFIVLHVRDSFIKILPDRSRALRIRGKETFGSVFLESKNSS